MWSKATDGIDDPWGERTPYGRGEPWPERLDEYTVERPGRWVPTASLLHSNGDGIDLGVRDGRLVGMRGRVTDRVNRGRLDPKDRYGWQANLSPDRLTRPLVRDGDRLVEASWDTATGRIVERAPRPAGPLPDDGRVRDLLDGRRAGRPGHPRRRP